MTKDGPANLTDQREIGCRQLSALLSLAIGAAGTRPISYSALSKSLGGKTKGESISRSDIKAYVLGRVWPHANTICRIGRALQDKNILWATEPLLLHQSGRIQEFVELLIFFLLQPLTGDDQRPRTEDVECLAIMMASILYIRTVTDLDQDPVIVDVSCRGARSRSQNEHIISAFAELKKKRPSQSAGQRRLFESRELARSYLRFGPITRSRFSMAWSTRNERGRIKLDRLPVFEELEKALAIAQDTFKPYRRREQEIHDLLEEAFLGELQLTGQDRVVRKMQKALRGKLFKIPFTRRRLRRLARMPRMNLLPPEYRPENVSLLDWMSNTFRSPDGSEP